MRVYISIFLLALLASCVTKKKLMVLNDGVAVDSVITNVMSNYKLQTGDILSLNVYSIDKEAIAVFQKQSGTNTQMNASPSAVYLTGYMVDELGDIDIPVIGKVNVKGATVEGAKAKMEVLFAQYFKYYTLDLKLSNYRVTVMGEVNQPGTQYVYNVGRNLLEIIADAGDFTEHGNRKKVHLVRKINGHVEEVNLNLQDKSIVNSLYFYPLPGDVFFVEPRTSKLVAINLQTLSLITTVVSLLTIALTFTNVNK